MHMNMNMNLNMNTYSTIGITYGAIRRGLQVIKAPVIDTRIAKHPNVSQMYVTTKVVLVAHGACCGSILWPLMIIKDLHEIEANIRGDTQCEERLTTIDYFYK
jgi:hypothetical protein